MKKLPLRFSRIRKSVQLRTRTAIKVNQPQGVSEAMLVALVTALSYAVAYSYNAGFASFFDLPPFLISPTVGTILQAAAAVGAVLLGFWNIVAVVWVFAPRGDTALVRSIRRFLVVLLVVGFFYAPIRDVKGVWILVAIILGLYVFFSFVFPLITQRNIAGYENKLLGQEEIERTADSHSLNAHVARALGGSALLVGALCVLLVYFSYFVGFGAAVRKENFLVLDGRPGYVVAALDDELLVLAGYDPATRKLTGNYQVERLAENHPWVLNNMLIGRLASRDKKSARPRHSTNSNK